MAPQNWLSQHSVQTAEAPTHVGIKQRHRQHDDRPMLPRHDNNKSIPPVKHEKRAVRSAAWVFEHCYWIAILGSLAASFLVSSFLVSGWTFLRVFIGGYLLMALFQWLILGTAVSAYLTISLICSPFQLMSELIPALVAVLLLNFMVFGSGTTVSIVCLLNILPLPLLNILHDQWLEGALPDNVQRSRELLLSRICLHLGQAIVSRSRIILAIIKQQLNVPSHTQLCIELHVYRQVNAPQWRIVGISLFNAIMVGMSFPTSEGPGLMIARFS